MFSLTFTFSPSWCVTRCPNEMMVASFVSCDSEKEFVLASDLLWATAKEYLAWITPQLLTLLELYVEYFYYKTSVSAFKEDNSINLYL